MRDLRWDEVFTRRPVDDDDDTPAPPRGLPAFFGTWEEWLTLAVVMTVYLSVVVSVQQARWVEEMPSLVPMALLGLAMAFVLSRVRLPEPLIHLVALPSLCGLVLLRLLADLPGDTPRARFAVLLQRMHEWFYAAFHQGVSSDPLPVIMLVLPLIALGAYVTAWSVFRWQNPWLGLVPGGAVILTNISYLPGQFSFAFVVFLFGAVLLLMRLHLTRRERQWQRDHTPYPGFISLSVFNATLWVATAVLVLAWAMPLANRAGPLGRVWDGIYQPLEGRMTGLARVFNSVEPKKPITIHNFDEFLPFQGSIDLRGRHTQIQIEGAIPPDVAAYLRARAYDVYNTDGWHTGDEIDGNLPDLAGAPPEQGRQTLTIKIKPGSSDTVLFSLGQPLDASVGAQAKAAAAGDIQAIRPTDSAAAGEGYDVTGSVSVATADELRAAGSNYPASTDRYLQLPRDLPSSVGALAHDLTQYEGNPYDQAAAIETYLRTYPIDNEVPGPDRGQDPVSYFLFDARRGYFDYHASAMVVLLRTLGIPSRLAVGYALTSASADGNSLRLDERSAFAWPEVYFPRYGWVEFNPTPSQPPINRPGQAAGSFLPPELQAKLKDLEVPLPAAGVVPTPQPQDLPEYASSGGGAAVLWPLLYAAAGLGALALVAAAGARFAWGFGLRGLDHPSRLWEKTVRLAALLRVRPAPNQTPREFARRLQSEAPDAGPVDVLAEAFTRSRFGRKTVSEEERTRLEEAWRTVRGRLVRRFLRRGRRL